MITRRSVLLALAAGTLAAPRALFAQSQKRSRVIGVIWERSLDPLALGRMNAFRSGMRELGYVEGKDYTIVLRSTGGDPNRLPAITAELIAAKVDLIMAIGTPSAVLARKLARDIPILVATVADPVGSGLAASLSRPGGTVTGLTVMGSDLYPKRLDLLRQIVPDLQRVGVVYNPDGGTDAQTVQELESATARLKVTMISAPVRNAGDVGAAFETLKRGRAQALIVAGSSAIIALRQGIIDQAAAGKLPAIYPQPDFAESGGLIAYAPHYEDLFRRAAGYADKIFKGAKPADLPIQQPNTFELVINMKTARALGIRIPDGVLLRASRVIE